MLRNSDECVAKFLRQRNEVINCKILKGILPNSYGNNAEFFTLIYTLRQTDTPTNRETETRTQTDLWTGRKQVNSNKK